ncbi:hypothetical protein Poli38472_002031 [Pythium oligandrum]|uniref:No apical meristem-associated C-terminal domain-containing protein n=1 Tax=Pythium oligandrum TaxID=41045 RepID=A0A8K1FGS4_PYTOL|nr:hypothetical protein Poli38472_002031 [Pythium oligandrum]|eukprot:TMW63090.1 hypothetical protein Poli38472_002031 [Pythium oligandrum]
MGKKTNWTVNEDQALCRAWQCASESALAQGGEQKAGTFWGVVHQLFHSELESSVDRPVNGLKIRWTRINRDVQRFAMIFNRLYTERATTEANSSTPSAIASVDPQVEQDCVEQAMDVFMKEQGYKFSFEPCWRQLRFSPKWRQLLACSTAGPVGGLSSPAFVAMDPSMRADVASAVSEDLGNSTLLVQQKRRLATMLETQSKSATELSPGLAQTIASELRRQNDLLEEQNALAVFRAEIDLIDDTTAREYFTMLRGRYAKKMRTSLDALQTIASSEVAGQDENGTAKANALV